MSTTYALITGASTGIGRELAFCFAQNRHNLILVARSADKLAALQAELQQQHQITVHVLARDLSTPEAAAELFAETSAHSWTVEFLVNNAGFGNYGYVQDLADGADENMLTLNVLTLTGLSERFAKDMLQRRRGRILNVASTAAFQPVPRMAAYAASKAFVLSFSEALSEELRGTGVTVSVLCPGPTATEFGKRAGVEMTRAFDGPLVMSAQQVAEEGYLGMMRGDVVIVNGKLNRVGVFANRFTPRAVSRRIAGELMRVVKQKRA
jgi:short-subunit dehydrogenase